MTSKCEIVTHTHTHTHIYIYIFRAGFHYNTHHNTRVRYVLESVRITGGTNPLGNNYLTDLLFTLIPAVISLFSPPTMSYKRRRYEDMANSEQSEKWKTFRAKVSGREKDLIEKYG